MSESGDRMREHLVIRANCAMCGGNVRFSGETQPPWKPGDSDTGITGAAQTSMRFSVWPCRKCYGDAKRPLEMMREALIATAPGFNVDGVIPEFDREQPHADEGKQP